MLSTRTPTATKVNRPVQRGESRKLERFSLRLPTRISTLESDTPPLDLITQNISAGGAFFPTTKPLPEGLAVLVEVKLRFESGRDGAGRVKVKGMVLRSQPDG